MEKLETVTGTLLQCYPQFEPGTIRTSVELVNEWRTNPDEEARAKFRRRRYWTSNFGMYRAEEGEVYLYLGGMAANPIFGNIGEATRELLTRKYYPLSKGEMGAVLDSGETRRFALSELNLTEYIWALEVKTHEYNSLNPTQRALAEMVYGDFEAIRRLLESEEVEPTLSLNLLNPKYIRRVVEEGGAIALPCLLGIVQWSLADLHLPFFTIPNVENPRYSMRGRLITSGD